jgi:flavin reductase (DIM6/NTAB) family NADH-FMN oxidoreductase RutF
MSADKKYLCCQEMSFPCPLTQEQESFEGGAMKEFKSAPHFHYLLHPYSTTLVTCCDEAGRPNIVTMAWVIPLSVEPPLVGMSIRQTRYSYGLIRETDEFVVNVAPYGLAEQALVCGRRSGRDLDKFAATGLTAGVAQKVQPPIIKECPGFLECRVVDDIKAGDHRLVIGEVLAAYAKAESLEDGGLRALNRAQPLLHIGKNCFTTTEKTIVEPRLSAR